MLLMLFINLVIMMTWILVWS